MPTTHAPLAPQPIGPAAVFTALDSGLRTFRQAAPLSVAFATLFALFGTGLIAALAHGGLAPMALPLVGGFLLVAPSLLAGFFGITQALRCGRRPAVPDILHGFRQSPAGLWGLVVICLFLFLIWITDAGILYSFMLGRSFTGWRMLFPFSGELLRFHAGALVAGSLFAVIAFCITAYAVPLLIERRTGLVRAVHASIRAILGSPAANLVWSLLLGMTIGVSILLPLLLTLTLPVMAFATEHLYRAVFPSEVAPIAAG